MLQSWRLAAMCVVSLAAACGPAGTAGAWAAPATQPVQIDPKAAAQLKLTNEAYGKLKSLSLSGTIDLAADISGQKANHHAEFTAAFSAPILFRHEVKDEIIADGTGDKIYIFLPTNNIYTVDDSPKGAAKRVKFDDLSEDLRGVLSTQDLSLALALSDNPGDQLTSNATAITPAADVTIDGSAFPAILITSAGADTTVAFDAKTHLIRRVITDESRGLRLRGADVKSAQVTVDYSQTAADAPVEAAQFAFTPPATAQEHKPQGASAMALVGKAAPDFQLKQLGGGEISAASLKGSVYVLDFWATWCGPCVQSLPGLDEIYKARKADGVKIFAVNQQEEADKVGAFVGEHKLTLPVLLDGDGKVGAAYGAEAIPETVVVGRDGLVKNVFVGSGNEENISAALGAALKGQ